MRIGFHASHEQFTPSELLEYVQAATGAGFTAAMCSDHFHPWTPRQGQSGFSWAWLGAALQATDVPFGVVCAVGQRYHPAIIAQATATLLQMYPGRFWIAAGSGQLLNEGITGEVWPAKEDRNERLRESVDVMRKLWDGDTVTHQGRVRVSQATLYTRANERPRVIAPALTPKTAEWAAAWADGLITISKSREEMSEIISAWKRGGGEGKPMYLQAKISYAATDDDALDGAFDQWRGSIFSSSVQTSLRTPDEFEAAAEFVKPNDMYDFVRISARIDDHIAWLHEDLEMGFEEIYLHNVNRDQQTFIKDFGAHVLTALADGGGNP